MTVYIFIWVTSMLVLMLEPAFSPRVGRTAAGFTLASLFFFVILIAGLRGVGVDKDYEAYRTTYDTLAATNYTVVEYLKSVFEVGSFYWLSLLALMIGAKFQILLLLIAFFSISLKFFLFSKKSLSVSGSSLYYFSWFYYLQDITQIRAGLAAALSLLAAAYLSEKKTKFFVIATICAVFVHPTAILFSLLLITSPRTIYRTKIYVLLLVSSMVIAALSAIGVDSLQNIESLIGVENVDIYFKLLDAGEHSEIKVFGLFPIMNSLFLILLISIRQVRAVISEQPLLISLFWAAFIGQCSWYLLSAVPVFAARVSQYLMIGMPFLAVTLFVYSKQRTALFSRVAFALFCLVTFYACIFHGQLLGEYVMAE